MLLAMMFVLATMVVAGAMALAALDRAEGQKSERPGDAPN